MASALPLDASPCRSAIMQGQPFAFGGRHQVANDGIIIVRDEDAANYPDEMYVPDDHLQQHSNDGVDDGIGMSAGQDILYDHEVGTTSGDGSDVPLALDDYQQQDSMGSSGCGSADGKSSRQSFHPPPLPRSSANSASPAQASGSGQSASSAGPIRNNSGTGAMPNKRWNGQRWNDNETRTLIDLFGKYPNLVGRRLWETIGEGLRARGFQRTDSQAREKWRDVYTFYKRQLESYQATGTFPDAPFFKQLHAIYSKREPPSSTGSWGRSPASAALARSTPMELAKASNSLAMPAPASAHPKQSAVTPDVKRESHSPLVARSSPSASGTLNLSQQSVISTAQRGNISNNSSNQVSQQTPQPSNTSTAQPASMLQQVKRLQQPAEQSPVASSSSSTAVSNRQTELLERIVKMQEQQLRMQNQLLQLERKRVANETKQTEYLGRLVAMLGDLDDMDGGDEMFVGDNSGEQLN